MMSRWCSSLSAWLGVGLGSRLGLGLAGGLRGVHVEEDLLGAAKLAWLGLGLGLGSGLEVGLVSSSHPGASGAVRSVRSSAAAAAARVVSTLCTAST